MTDEAIQAAYFDDNYADAEPATEYNASHILVETEEEAQAWSKRLDGGADFADVGRRRIPPAPPAPTAASWAGSAKA